MICYEDPASLEELETQRYSIRVTNADDVGRYVK
jgi:hypothetical protein